MSTRSEISPAFLFPSARTSILVDRRPFSINSERTDNARARDNLREWLAESISPDAYAFNCTRNDSSTTTTSANSLIFL